MTPGKEVNRSGNFRHFFNVDDLYSFTCCGSPKCIFFLLLLCINEITPVFFTVHSLRATRSCDPVARYNQSESDNPDVASHTVNYLHRAY
jgi:hypothetical protein